LVAIRGDALTASRKSASGSGREPAIDILVQSPRWRAQRGVAPALRRAIAAAAASVPTSAGEVAIVLLDDSAMRALNRTWRRKDAPTNVLSFAVPARKGGRGTAKRRGTAGHNSGPMGDIVIAYETTLREAKAEKKPFSHHLAHLAVHGYLHLVGYDHETDVEAEAMELLEISILARLKIANPYIGRDAKR
jgi:probable rRNA maturation factor